MARRQRHGAIGDADGHLGAAGEPRDGRRHHAGRRAARHRPATRRAREHHRRRPHAAAMRLLRLSAVASALVAAGCTSVPPDDTNAFTPGTGTVEAVHAPRVARWIEGYQLSLRM